MRLECIIKASLIQSPVMAVLIPSPPAMELTPHILQLDLFGNHTLSPCRSKRRAKKGRKKKEGGKKGFLSKDKRKKGGKKKAELQYQRELSIFQEPPTETEYLLFLLWDALKKQDEDAFLECNRALSNWLLDEQYELLLSECRQYFSLHDKVWLLSILGGHFLRPLSLLYCHKWQWHGLIVGNNSCSVLLILFLALWENNSTMSSYGANT